MSISCTEKEVKLVTGSGGQERLTRLCSAYGKPFPFMIKDSVSCSGSKTVSGLGSGSGSGLGSDSWLGSGS